MVKVENMGHIFYIIGPSSSGKDTIYKNIIQNHELNLQKIVMYTTRPIREGEKEGIEYHFVDSKQLKLLEDEGKVIEKRTYDTMHGLWDYFTVANEEINLDTNNYLMIGTLQSFIETSQFFGNQKVVPILVMVEDGIRLQRALQRELKQEEPKYQELCRRFLADSQDFSEEKIEEAGIHKVFLNHELDDCIHEIINYILEIKSVVK